MPLWTVFALAPLVVQLVLLSVLGGAVNRMAYRLFGKTIYLLLMWPGVMVHELSHLVGCLFTRTKVRKVALFSPREEGGGLVLGFVEHDRPRNPVVMTFVAGAPFFGGAAAVLGLTRSFLPVAVRSSLVPIGVARPELASLASSLARAFEGYAAATIAAGAAVDWTSWKTWLFVYLLFSIAANLAPSRPDLAHAAAGAAFAALAFLLFEWAASRYAPGAAAPVAAWTASAAGGLTVLLGYGLAAIIAAAAALFALTLAKTAVSPRR